MNFNFIELVLANLTGYAILVCIAWIIEKIRTYRFWRKLRKDYKKKKD